MVRIFQILYLLETAKRRMHWDRQRLKQFQDKKLRTVLRIADQTVPFYHQHFKQAGVDITEIKGIEDLPKLPFITKQQLKSVPTKEIVSTAFNPNILHAVRTSGSTGKPLQVFITPQEDAWRKSIYMRANVTCGQKLRDRWVVLTAPHHFGDTTRLQRKLGIYAQNCVSLFESNTEKVRQIEEINPDVLDGYSGALVLLAKEIKRRGLKTINPHLVLGNAELIDHEAMRYLEDVFGAPYCDQFGCAEVDRTAWQCLKRNGYHMDVDSVITEFIDKNGQPVAPNEKGEVTYTSLFNFAMPFIRYSIGDIAVPSDEDVCPCGCTLPLMKVIEGRKDAFLTFPKKQVYSPMIFNYAISTFGLYQDIDQYQIHQTRLDNIDVYLKLNKHTVKQEEMARLFEEHVKKFFKLTDDIQFNVSFPEEIPLSKTGKLRSVWSDVPMPGE